MWRVITFIIILTSYNSIANAQNDWYEKYLSCVNDSDVHAWKAMIEQWERAEPESPDVYAAWYNYYIKLAMTDVVALTTTAPEDNQDKTCCGTQQITINCPPGSITWRAEIMLAFLSSKIYNVDIIMKQKGE